MANWYIMMIKLGLNNFEKFGLTATIKVIYQKMIRGKK